jgi:hypothetical protein
MKISSRRIRVVLLYAFIFCSMIKPLLAQKDMTIYPMQNIPQSNNDNPALIPDCKLHIGCMPIIPFPALGSLYFGVSNTGFTYGNMIHKVTVDSNQLDFSKQLTRMGKRNYFATDMNYELFSFGVRINRFHYVSLNVHERASFRFCYPRDLMTLAWKGNSAFIGETANLDHLSIDLIHYHEIALGYSYQYNDKWSFGGRIKILAGLSNVWTKTSKAEISINDSTYDHTIVSKLELNMAATNEIMNMMEGTSDGNSFDPINYILDFNNLGVAADLGISYKINKQFQLSASLLDLGTIHWKGGARNYIAPLTTFNYQGFDITPIIRKQETFGEMMKEYGDSLKKLYQFDTTQNAYWAPLNPSVYLSGSYEITKKDAATLVARMEIYQGTVHPAVAIGYYRKVGNAASISVNYSYNSRSWLNFGFGAAFKMGPLQYFVTTDNFFSAIMPYAVKNINLHVGCNLVFFYKKSYPLLNLYDK